MGARRLESEALTAALWERGYSLLNQGDVNPQSLAGAIATGTHGTGAELGSLSTFARAFRLMLADGSVVECSRNSGPTCSRRSACRSACSASRRAVASM